QRAKDAMLSTLDEAMGGLEDDKENLLQVYTWAIYVYENIIDNPNKVQTLTAERDRVRKEWEAAGRPGPDDDDQALPGTAAAEEDAPPEGAEGDPPAASGDAADSTGDTASGGEPSAPAEGAPPTGDTGGGSTEGTRE
ncbi:MAG TPA: hypothetical protein VEI97_08570, partial [bacterium]|nr:hypothetical protein [bacterium]